MQWKSANHQEIRSPLEICRFLWFHMPRAIPNTTFCQDGLLGVPLGRVPWGSSSGGSSPSGNLPITRKSTLSTEICRCLWFHMLRAIPSTTFSQNELLGALLERVLWGSSPGGSSPCESLLITKASPLSMKICRFPSTKLQA